jgi:hypothetical protein
MLVNFDSIHKNHKIWHLFQHLKTLSKHVMAFGSSWTSPKNQIFNLIHYAETPSLVFKLNLAFVHYPFVSLFSGNDINLDIWFDTKLLDKTWGAN